MLIINFLFKLFKKFSILKPEFDSTLQEVKTVCIVIIFLRYYYYFKLIRLSSSLLEEKFIQLEIMS